MRKTIIKLFRYGWVACAVAALAFSQVERPQERREERREERRTDPRKAEERAVDRETKRETGSDRSTTRETEDKRTETDSHVEAERRTAADAKPAARETFSERKERERQERKLEEVLKQTPEQREQELGKDPARGYIESEGKVGAEIEARYGHFERSADPGAEWVSLSGEYRGKTFDLMGGPPKGSEQELKVDEFNRSLDKHVKKADYIVVDTRTMTKEQRAAIKEHIETSGAERSKIIVLE